LNIHPTAIIESGARLADNVEVGAYAIVGSETELAADCVIESHAVIKGAVKIDVGNLIGHGAVIGGAPQDLGFKPTTRSGVVIGARNVIREHCTIHRGASEDSNTTLGDDNFLMAGTHMGHNSRVANGVIVANNCLLAGYVTVDDSAFLGGGCVFHQHVRVGRLAITQGGSAFSKDVPPYVIAAGLNLVFGLNAIGLKRAGLTREVRSDIKRAFKLLYASGLNVTQAVGEAHTKEWSEPARAFFEFVAAANTRGISAYNRADRATNSLGQRE
jgi:UDP-N-acetylglucosamine acyltransferase